MPLLRDLDEIKEALGDLKLEKAQGAVFSNVISMDIPLKTEQ